MSNKKALEFFYNMSQNNNSPQSVKLAYNNDYTQIDADFILKFADSKSELLDLGTGTGLTINKIYDKVSLICVVEPYVNFTNFIIKSPNIEINNIKLLDYNSSKQFDLITLFGIMHYFDEEEAIEIYRKYCSNLKPNGKIIVKNQFGIKEDVIVDGYSEEQKNYYYSSYRHIEKEPKILKSTGYTNIEIFDIYPPEYNRWNNTHFYAIVAEKA